MGQKVSPTGLRIGINKPWSSSWLADKKHIPIYIVEDCKIRDLIKVKHANASISKIDIERSGDMLTVDIYTGRPGVLIGQKGAGIESIRKDIEKISSTKTTYVNVKEVKNLDMDAKLVAEGIASQLEKRAQFRRVMKMAVQRTMRAGARGIKVGVSGRLDGAEIARSEKCIEGSLPLHTLRADIDYALVEAHTIFGVIGVKVWIYKGDIIGSKTIKNDTDTNKGGY